MSEFQKTPWVKQRWCALVLMVLGLVAGPAALAQTAGDPNKYSSTPGNPACRFFDGFADNGDGTVTDPRNGLMWKRCAEGSAWNGKACSVAGSTMNWMEAMKTAKVSRFLGHSDWRLPTRGELNAVVGNYEQCKTNDAKKRQYAASAAIAHPVDKNLDAGWFWSSSPHEDAGVLNIAFRGSPRLGSISKDNRWDSNVVRLVRLGSPTNSIGFEFDTEYLKLAQYHKPIDEYNSKFKADQTRAAAVKSLLAQGPQGLYLQAGRAQRDGGGARINGEYFSAKQMYDLIVDNFPRSEFAVKASDQLNAIARGEAQERAEGDARVRAWCEAELRRREATCKTYSYQDPGACMAVERRNMPASCF